MPIPPAARLGPYEIVGPLGSGGMGEVYRARDTRLERPVALKVLSPRLSDDPAFHKRFEREAKAAAALSHPGIVSVFDVGTSDGAAYVVMELVEGRSLRERLRAGRLSREEALRVGAELAEALAAAHEAGIVHRDLKPENVLLTAEGRAKVADFGLARLGSAAEPLDSSVPTSTGLTVPGAVMGTPGYMAPEQARGEAVDAPADIFALGCVLYEMLTGTGPFARATAADSLAATLWEEPPRLDTGSEEGRIVARCLAKQPRDRFRSARDLAFQLRALQAPSRRRRRVPLTGAAAVALLALAASAWLVPTLLARRAPIDSLAVLPFANGSGDPELDYLGDGIAESLINDLSDLQGLRVVPRTTVFRFREAADDPRRVARELKVRAVLTGRVTQRGEAVTVQVDLVDTASDAQLWGERYERPLEDLAGIQRDISQTISSRLRLRLREEERERLSHPTTADGEAYQSYLKGLHHFYRFTVGSFERALEEFRDAASRDPRFAAAHFGLAISHLARGYFGIVRPSDSMPRALAAAERALELDPALAEGYVARAAVRLFYDWDLVASERDFRRALELNPRLPLAHYFHGWWFVVQGRHDEGIAAVQRAHELDPLNLLFGADLAIAYVLGGRDRDALAQVDRTLQLDPNYGRAFSVRETILHFQGRVDDMNENYMRWLRARGEDAAAVELREVLAREGTLGGLRWRRARLIEATQAAYVSPWHRAMAAVLAEDCAEVVAWLAKGVEERVGDVAFLGADPPWFRGCASEPGYQELVRRVGLRR